MKSNPTNHGVVSLILQGVLVDFDQWVQSETSHQILRASRLSVHVNLHLSLEYVARNKD